MTSTRNAVASGTKGSKTNRQGGTMSVESDRNERSTKSKDERKSSVPNKPIRKNSQQNTKEFRKKRLSKLEKKQLGQKRALSGKHGERPSAKRQATQKGYQSQDTNKKPFGAETGSYRSYYKRRANSERNSSFNRYKDGEGNEIEDDRLPLIEKVIEKFIKQKKRNPRILDVGCNNGTVTLNIARFPLVSEIVGIDVDKGLIKEARVYLKQMMIEANDVSSHHAHTSEPFANNKATSTPFDLNKTVLNSSKATESTRISESNENDDSDDCNEVEDKSKENNSSTKDEKSTTQLKNDTKDTKDTKNENDHNKPDLKFPYNATFRIEDIVEGDSQVSSEKGKYDIVVCLSVTKWIHIKYGDEGLERLFKTMKDCLKDDGCLILEPQKARSYKIARRKGLCPNDFDLGKCRLKPELFRRHLLNECGFEGVEMLRDVRKGHAFNRPVMAFYRKKEDAPQPKIKTTVKREAENSEHLKKNNQQSVKEDKPDPELTSVESEPAADTEGESKIGNTTNSNTPQDHDADNEDVGSKDPEATETMEE